MRLKFIRGLAASLCLSLAVRPTLFARNDEDSAKQAAKVSKFFQEIMDATDKGDSESVLDKAQCIAVFPQVLKAGFIVGGLGGRGVASCRVPNGLCDPAYFDLKGGSFGLQIGVQATDFVLLFMNHERMESLLKSKFEMGGDASVSAGPVGREAGASTDLKLDPQILSYSRSKGLFAGLELKGAVISLDNSDMKSTYGEGVKAEDLLTGKKHGPESVAVRTTLATARGAISFDLQLPRQ
ncbi:MAG: lipid-binding SYLF domain-containing protein [Chloracidobacterium sp.]|nr:lipid-binding SYLF domain-containing protein [Chloracidobacterium sp.]